MNRSKDDKRTPNFTTREKDYLFNIIATYAHILEDKKTNRTSIEEKNKVWKKIEEKFNSDGPIICYRNSDQLKRLYDNKKKDLRKKLAEHKKEVFLTGGGPPPDSKLDSIDELLIQIVNEKSVNGFSVPFDSDCEPLLKTTNTNDSAAQVDDVIEFEYIPNEVSNQDQNIEVSFEDEFISEVPRYKRKCPPQYLQEPLSAELNLQPTSSKIAGDTISEGDALTPKPKKSKVLQTNRRRPQAGVRALTSSDVAEKYNLLLDRRLILIEKQLEQATELQNFTREEQKIKMEILKQQQEVLSFEKEEKKLKVELLKLEVQYKKSLFLNV